MPSIVFGGRTYQVDNQEFLLDSGQWDEAFARGMAHRVGIPGELSEKHWELIRFIREEFWKSGACPVVYAVCREFRLQIQELKKLFPTGYVRGACKLAGITCAGRLTNFCGEPSEATGPLQADGEPALEKAYRVNALGFLLDPAEWDETFAEHKARELGTQGELSRRHWEVIRYLRERHERTGNVPTVFETCAACEIEMEELEQLFPTGYQRGAVKIAGLRCTPDGHNHHELRWARRYLEQE